MDGPAAVERRTATVFPMRGASLGYSMAESQFTALPATSVRQPYHVSDYPMIGTPNSFSSNQTFGFSDAVGLRLAKNSSNEGIESATEGAQALPNSDYVSRSTPSSPRRAASPLNGKLWVSPPLGLSSQQFPNHPPRLSASDDIHQRVASAPSDVESEEHERIHERHASLVDGYQAPDVRLQLHFHHESVEDAHSKMDHRASCATVLSAQSDSQTSSSSSAGDRSSSPRFLCPGGLQSRQSLSRPVSNISLGSENYQRGRPHSQHLSVHGSPGVSPFRNGMSLSPSRRSPDSRPVSYVDLLNTPYSQQIAPTPSLNNSVLRGAVGNNASLLDTKKTLEMYRANVKKTTDEKVQYEFAVLLVNLAHEMRDARPTSRSPSPHADSDGLERAQFISEAKHILHGLAGRSYPFAQYLLADGYTSGFFSKGKEDYHTAFSLFVSAAKHGHAEAGYRAALCYEFGWGSKKDYAKAVQFYRQSASKNHPGAATRLGKACLSGDMGLENRYREGLKWLKRAAESADVHHNAAPYELGLLHEQGYGDDVFKDEAYAAQLFTQSADLGHAMANLRMGEAYEHGLLGCPRDPALSVHFYNGAALAGMPQAMMALCAWYMVGAEPLLEKDESEAFEWAKKAAELQFPKAEYAVGYFTEMGIGCRRDLLEANVWYVRAADQGDERAKHRLSLIRAAASGDPRIPPSQKKSSRNLKSKRSIIGIGGGECDDKECSVM